MHSLHVSVRRGRIVALGSAGQWNRSSSRVASAEGFLLLVSPVEPPNIRSLWLLLLLCCLLSSWQWSWLAVFYCCCSYSQKTFTSCSVLVKGHIFPLSWVKHGGCCYILLKRISTHVCSAFHSNDATKTNRSCLIITIIKHLYTCLHCCVQMAPNSAWLQCLPKIISAFITASAEMSGSMFENMKRWVPACNTLLFEWLRHAQVSFPCDCCAPTVGFITVRTSLTKRWRMYK